jgi:hypothetical protein
MGKGETESSKIAAQGQADAAKGLVEMSKQLWGEAAPLRKASGEYYTDILKGGPSLTRAVAPQVNAATNQFAAAMKGLKSGLPPGGFRDVSLRDLKIGEAGTKAGIYSGGVNEAAARVASQGTMGTQAGISSAGSGGSTYGGASQNFANLANMKAQGWGDLATGVGSMIAMI